MDFIGGYFGWIGETLEPTVAYVNYRHECRQNNECRCRFENLERVDETVYTTSYML